jgi:hypothetical protein
MMFSMVVDGKRQRDKTVTVRLSKDEHEQLTSLSSRSGLALGALCAPPPLATPVPRAQRMPRFCLGPGPFSTL